MTSTLNRRQFVGRTAALAGLAAAGPAEPGLSRAADRMNILCWEGYNSDEVLGPFRDANPGATVRAESGTSDPDMINKLRAGEIRLGPDQREPALGAGSAVSRRV